MTVIIGYSTKHGVVHVFSYVHDYSPPCTIFSLLFSSLPENALFLHYNNVDDEDDDNVSGGGDDHDDTPCFLFSLFCALLSVLCECEGLC